MVPSVWSDFVLAFHLYVFLFCNGETAVDRGGRSAPVLVELQPHGSGVNDLRDQRNMSSNKTPRPNMYQTPGV